MVHELTVYKLGKLLSELSSEYNVSLLVKRKLSGGFITVTGKVDVDYIPTDKKTLKGLQAKRADIITAGVKILNIVMEKLEFEKIMISEYDNLEGLMCQNSKNMS